MTYLVLLAVLGQELPGVHSVTTRVGTEPRITHILNWHYVSEEDFTADLRDQGVEDIEGSYETFLDEVQAVQQEQIALLKAMGVKRVYLEGLTAENVARYRALIDAMKKYREPKGDGPTDQFLRQQYRIDLLMIGAPGRLLLEGVDLEVLPLDDPNLFKQANPVVNGKFQLDAKANERREDAMVKLLDGPSVIILGGGHNLSDNTKREYVRIETKAYRRVRQ